MIYASHVLEHLTMNDSRKALKEWLRVLKPGGYLDVAVPDINQVYLLWKKGAKWGDYQQMCDELYINATAFGANLLAEAIPEMADTYGGPGHQHKQIFIHDMLLQRVLEAGFVEVHETTSCFLRQSAIGEVMVQARKAWYELDPPMTDNPPQTKE
jgi:ubiquinone/menaquinone biosynthesis C-methylase UbiE